MPYRTNTGFAWNYIEGLYAEVADALAGDGVRTFVAYPEIVGPPQSLASSVAVPIGLDATLDSWRSIRATMREIRQRDIRVLYFTDRGWWHWALPLLRMAGVRRIVAHDHTSGSRTAPRGLKRLAKWIMARIPLVTADRIVTVSEYVARRHREVGLTPPARITRVWNGIRLPELPPAWPRPDAFGPSGRPVVLCVCRAAPEKGVAHLLSAFDRMASDWPAARARPLLVYVGDGPILEELQGLRAALDSREDIVLTGYRSDVAAFIAHASVSVVPSVWQDACPLGVLEPMAYGKPVVASAVGGVPEMIDSAAVGALVPPGDPVALAEALRALLLDPARQAAVGQAARRRVESHFARRAQIDSLVAMVRGDVWPAPTNAR